MSGVLIRRAGREDAGLIHHAALMLSRHLGEEEKIRATPEDYLEAGWGQAPLFRALVAEEGTRLAAVALFFPEYSTLRGRAGVYLQDLWVEPAHRGQGLSRRMIAAVLRDAAAWGAGYLKLSARASNTDAVAVYDRLGFVCDRDDLIFTLEGEPFARLREAP